MTYISWSVDIILQGQFTVLF